jgi:hypothetical protein
MAAIGKQFLNDSPANIFAVCYAKCNGDKISTSANLVLGSNSDMCGEIRPGAIYQNAGYNSSKYALGMVIP